MASKLKKSEKKRLIFQLSYLIFSSPFIINFFKGTMYRGELKYACLPGLSCYSCPSQAGACPIGAYQAVVNDRKFSLSFYVLGFLLAFSTVFARFICGNLCPFGFFQDLLHKIPIKKLSDKKLKFLTNLKYFILVFLVILIPALITNNVGTGDPYFCKYLCPSGILTAAIPLSIVNEPIRASLGNLFIFKLSLLIGVIIVSILIYRPFCKYLCPLGAFYALFNKHAIYRYNFNESKCNGCKACERVCKMGVKPYYNPNDKECIRCGACIAVCSQNAITKTMSLKEYYYDQKNNL